VSISGKRKRWLAGCELDKQRFPSDRCSAEPVNAKLACREIDMSLGTILIIILVLVLLGALPTWPYSSGWGVYPSGGIGLILVIVLILVLLGRI
jgi:hypothetical protein